MAPSWQMSPRHSEDLHVESLFGKEFFYPMSALGVHMIFSIATAISNFNSHHLFSETGSVWVLKPPARPAVAPATSFWSCRWAAACPATGPARAAMGQRPWTAPAAASAVAMAGACAPTRWTVPMVKWDAPSEPPYRRKVGEKTERAWVQKQEQFYRGEH